MATNYCGQCGQPVIAAANFCANCGAAIDRRPSASNALASPETQPGNAGEAAVNQNKRTKNIVIAAISVAVVAVVVIAIFIVAQPKQYSGYPSDVVRQVGVVELGGDRNIVAEMTVSASLLSVEKGQDYVALIDPIDSHYYGTASLSTPAAKAYTGTIVVKGRVFTCDGVDSISLSDATIVRGAN